LGASVDPGPGNSEVGGGGLREKKKKEVCVRAGRPLSATSHKGIWRLFGK